MIERVFVKQKKREFQIQEFVSESMKNVGHSHTRVQRTPLGDKIIIYTSMPGLVVGRKGQNIAKMTRDLKTKFNLDNPQIEIAEIDNPNLDAQIVGEKIAASLERYGINRFKGVMHKAMEDVLGAGARGIELVLSGKVPSARARSWRVYGGYLKKSGDVSTTQIRKAKVTALLKSGIVGIKVKIMPPDIKLPDDLQLIEAVAEEKGTPEPLVETKKVEKASEAEVKEKPKQRPSRKSKSKENAEVKDEGQGTAGTE